MHQSKSESYLSIPRPVWVLGVVSLLTDLSSEMIYPLLPMFIVQTLGASTIEVGLIEGFVDGLAAILKQVSGKYSDRFARKKGIVVCGYSISSLSRPLVALASTWGAVFLIRSIDRVGKGVRSAPRDVMIANVCSPDNLGKSFGLHRAMDHMGAVIGPLVAGLLLAQFHLDLRYIFAASAIPALITILVLIFCLKEKVSNEIQGDHQAHEMDAQFIDDQARDRKVFFQSIAVFTLGNSTDAFLLLKFSENGFSMSQVALIWSAHHFVKSVSNYFFGNFSDRIGHLKMLRFGWLFYALTYLLFALTSSATVLLIIFMIYGVYYGLCEPSEKSYLVKLTPLIKRGEILGRLHMVLGLGALPASVIFGAIWKFADAQYAFYFGACMALLAVLNSFRLKGRHP